jgi:mannose-6-phosphate isomerase-like protein (cupin superfamily)
VQQWTKEELMHIHHKRDIQSPIVTEHGEIIFELIGRGIGEPTERHSIAYVTIPSGKSSLMHYHPEAEESYFILRGQARMIIGEEDAVVGPGHSILIQPQKPHKIVNIGHEDLEFLAVCVPAWEPTNSIFLEGEGNGS